MKKLAIFLLCIPLTAQTINPNQIRPGTNGQALITTGGQTVWGASGTPISFQTNGSNNSSQSLLNFVNPTSFNGLTFTFSNPTGGNQTFALGGTLGNAGLTNPSFTLGSTSIALGSTATAVAGLGVNGVTLNAAGSPSLFLNQAGGYTAPSGGGVTSINTVAGAFTFNFSSGAGSCTTTTCTFTGSGSGGGSVTNFIASTGGWPSWLVPSVATSTTTPTLSVSASAIPNAALANSAVTIGSTSVSLGATAATIAGLTLTSPILTTPALGTPASGVLTNATGLPLTSGAGVVGTLPIANGGTGTTSPAIVAGTNVTVSGSWPNQTINSTGGGSGLSGQTTNCVPKAATATTSTSSAAICDASGIVTVTEPVTVNDGSGRGGGFDGTEGTSHTGSTGVDNLYADATTHRIVANNNNSGAHPVAQLIASGTSALGTSAIASGACATVVTTSATGVASTDTISWNPNGSIKAVTGYVPSISGGLSIAGYPTTNNVNWDVCNWSAASITPGAVTLNWSVSR